MHESSAVLVEVLLKFIISSSMLLLMCECKPTAPSTCDATFCESTFSIDYQPTLYDFEKSRCERIPKLEACLKKCNVPAKDIVDCKTPDDCRTSTLDKDFSVMVSEESDSQNHWRQYCSLLEKHIRCQLPGFEFLMDQIKTGYAEMWQMNLDNNMHGAPQKCRKRAQLYIDIMRNKQPVSALRNSAVIGRELSTCVVTYVLMLLFWLRSRV